METTVYVQVSKAEVLRILNSVPSEAVKGGPADAILVGAGTATLRRIESAFLVKSRGGTDETGERWAPLSPATIAWRIRKKQKIETKLDLAKRESWWEFYREALSRYKDRGAAIRTAWARIRKGGGVPAFDKYSASSVPILIDTQALIESLSVGSQSAHSIFRVTPGVLELGTDRKGAADHHTGIRGKLPQRRLWPHPSKWTPEWWQDVLYDAREGLIQLIVSMLEGK